jgi:2-methylisocitrate lyase-like PEP mutase family enzyme
MAQGWNMDKERQLHFAEAFRARHEAPHLLLLANAWDALSARIVEEAGFDAVATTSGGVSWVLGYADGEAAPWSEVVAATARMARVLRVPLTADIEAGYGGSPAEVAKSVGEIIAAGAVGINLEDGTGRADAPMLGIDEAASRIRAARNAAREAAVPIVINASIDIYLKQIGDPASRFAETVRRAEAYLAAGADCIFPFAVTDADTIGRLTQAIEAPINIVGRAGTPDVATLERLGVRRVSTASSLAMMAIEETQRVARELRKGSFDILNYKLKRPDIQNLFYGAER